MLGKIKMWAAQFIKQLEPNRWATSGWPSEQWVYGLPAAVGAQIAAPERQVIAILGDGGIQMTIQELGTIACYKLPVKIFIINNSVLGMVRQWQTMFYRERYSYSVLANPDFEILANAYGNRCIYD